MSTPKLLGIKILVSLFICFVTFNCIAQCKTIDADAKVVKAINDASGRPSIVVDFKSQNKETFKVSLFGPNKKNELNVEKTTFNDLVEGKYVIVIVAKREQDNYCPKSINVTIN